MINALEFNAISKNYKDTKALSDINLKLQENKIYGLIGRNGAGKSTLLKIASAQTFSDNGDVKIYGIDPNKNEETIKKLCFIRDTGVYPKDFKVKDILNFAALMYPNWDGKFAEDLIRIFELDVKKRYKALSRGMESIVGIIIGLASRAPITIFDEPHLGLDAVARQTFYDILIEDYSNNPRTIIISTHLIDEVSKIFERVIMIDKGRILMEEDVDELRGKAFYISGNSKVIDEISHNKRVIHKEEMGSVKSIGVFDKLGDEEIRIMKEKEIKVTSMSLQYLFVYLTNTRQRGDLE